MARHKPKPPLMPVVPTQPVNFMEPPLVEPGGMNPLKSENGDWDWEKIVDIICDRIVGSTQYLSNVVEEGFEGHDFPDLSKIRYKLYRDERFKARYREARVIQTDGIVDLMHKVVSDESKDLISDAHGTKGNSAAVGRSRLIVDHYKWYVGVIDPDEWTGKTKVEHSGTLSLEGILDDLRNNGRGKLPVEESPLDE